MSGQIVITPVAGAGYVARDEHGRTGEGPSPEAAVVNLRAAAAPAEADVPLQRMREPQGDHPILKWAGTLPDDDLTREWRQHVEEFRRQRDAEAEQERE